MGARPPDRRRRHEPRRLYRAARRRRGDAFAPRQRRGLFSEFENPQTERYDLTIAVRLQVIDPSGQVVASVDAKATRSTSVAEDATLNDRERVWFTLTEQTMRDLNASLEKGIPVYLQSYLRS